LGKPPYQVGNNRFSRNVTNVALLLALAAMNMTNGVIRIYSLSVHAAESLGRTVALQQR